MAYGELVVGPETPMPKGYGFLKKGNPFMTSLCRRKVRQAGEKLYVVKAGARPLGLRAPRWTLAHVAAQERATRSRRRAAVRRRDRSEREKFLSALLRRFPAIPPQDLATISRRALKKRSGRVGRSSKLGVAEKAQRAVAAHVRHRYTPYDKIMDGQEDKEEARKAVRLQAHRILRAWAQDPPREPARARHARGSDDGAQNSHHQGSSPSGDSLSLQESDSEE